MSEPQYRQSSNSFHNTSNSKTIEKSNSITNKSMANPFETYNPGNTSSLQSSFSKKPEEWDVFR